MDDDPEHLEFPRVIEDASVRLRAANLMPPVHSITSYDGASVVVSGRDGIAASESALITQALGSIPHQVVDGPRFPAIRFGAGGNPEGSPMHAAFQAALHAQNFCTGYELSGGTPGADRPVTFTCKCGRLSGEYADMTTANAVLDEHLEQQESAMRSFSQEWFAKRRSST